MMVSEGLTEHFITTADRNFSMMLFEGLLTLYGDHDAGYDDRVAKRYQECEG